MIDTTEIEKLAVRKNNLPAPLLPLERLAWNYWWSWTADGASIFRDLEPEIWEECEHNPRQLLARTSSYRLAQAATDPAYLERVKRLVNCFNHCSLPVVVECPSQRPNPVAYVLSMEFTTRSNYSGGLHSRRRSLVSQRPRLPLVAIGLLYRYGYPSATAH